MNSCTTTADEWLDDDSRLMAEATNHNGSMKQDALRSRVPGATDRGSTFHSEETLVLVYAVTLAPGA